MKPSTPLQVITFLGICTMVFALVFGEIGNLL